jgi:hypothetical protein
VDTQEPTTSCTHNTTQHTTKTENTITLVPPSHQLAPERRHALLPKVKGRRQGGDGVVKEVGGDDTSEQQGEVACANLVCVMVGVGDPPIIC